MLQSETEQTLLTELFQDYYGFIDYLSWSDLNNANNVE
jgi:hypothetical protein